jgi:oligopeptide/dipeptide ABC transporter ATP-binding protein
MAALLEVEGLGVRFRTDGGVVRAVDDVSFTLSDGKVLAIVGESGSGKSVTALTLMGLTRSPNTELEGSVRFDGKQLLDAPDRDLRRVRGGGMAMVFQNPMTALNPVQRVGAQIVEQIRAHERISRDKAWKRAIALLGRVGITRPEVRARAYPHEFSGGMRQRVMIAAALSCKPRLIIADEPTTALDVTTQSQIMDELEELCRESTVALILITHDIGLVARMADDVMVMYGGRVLEHAPADALFEGPLHPYTWALLRSVPRLDKERVRRLPTIGGSPPSLLNPPAGCHFRPRCPYAFERCSDIPPLQESTDPATDGNPAKEQGGSTHLDRCWLDLDTKRKLRRLDADAEALVGTDGAP